jgi:putative glycosyltransferase
MGSAMKLSIVSTLYCSAPYLSEFHRRVSDAAKQLAGNEYEIILVNDGSPDDCLAQAIQISTEDARVTVVDLSRNFGHHRAMMVGLEFATGELIFLIDSDLEEEPEWLLPFFNRMQQENCDVVYGVQAQRKGDVFERWTGHIFYRLFRFLSGLDLPDNITVARIMTRRYIDALIRHGEYEIFMAGLWVITGFDQRKHVVTKLSKGRSSYSLGKKISQLVNSIASFSKAPLVGIFFVGFAIFAISSLYITFLLGNWLFWSRPPTGYTSLIASIWLLGGMIIAFIGIIGIYLSKIYLETKRRPNAIVRHVYGTIPREPRPE